MLKEPHIVSISQKKVTALRCCKECDSTEYYIGAATQALSNTKRRKFKLLICVKCSRKYVTSTKLCKEGQGEKKEAKMQG